MNKTLEELFMEIFEDKNAEEKLKNASTIEEIYDCCRSKGYRKNIAAFEIELKNLIYEINQTLNIPEDFLEKVAGGITNSRFNKMTAGLLSLMSLGSVTASPIGAVPNLSNSAPIKNKLSINTALSKESLKKYGAILGAPAALIAGGGGLPLLLTLKNEIQSTKKASLKKTSQLIIDEAKDLDKFNSLKTEDIAGIFSTILDEVYGYINQEKPKDIIFPKSNRDLLAAILQQLHTITSKLDKESSQYKKLEKLKLAFIGLNHELFKNNQSAVSSQIAPPSAPSLPSFTPPPAPPPPPLPLPTPQINKPSTPKPKKKTSNSSNLQIENTSGASFMEELQEKLKGGVNNILGSKKNSQRGYDEEKFKKISQEQAAKAKKQKEQQKQKIDEILKKFPDLKLEWISNRCNKLNEEIQNKIGGYAKLKNEEKVESQQEIYNSLYEYEFLNELNHTRRGNPVKTHNDDNLERIRLKINNGPEKLYLSPNKAPANPYKGIDYKELVQRIKDRETNVNKKK